MNRDGTPETKLEEWLLDMGLGHIYLLSHGADDHRLTKAQTDALSESKPDVMYNAGHRYLLEKYQRIGSGAPESTPTKVEDRLR